MKLEFQLQNLEELVFHLRCITELRNDVTFELKTFSYKSEKQDGRVYCCCQHCYPRVPTHPPTV